MAIRYLMETILMILFYIAFRTTMYRIDKSISPEQQLEDAFDSYPC